jgi:arylsulfatase A-like enzyme
LPRSAGYALVVVLLVAPVQGAAAGTTFLVDLDVGSTTVELGGEYRPVLTMDGRRRVTRPIHIGPGAQLRLGMGLDPARCAGHPVTDFRVDALGAGAPRELLRRRLDPRNACGRWTDAEVSLAALESRTISFRFRVRASAPAARSSALHAVWGDPFVTSPVPGPAPPNIVLVSLDALGARHLTAYGYDHPTSPHLSALAAEGALFAHALSHYPSTAGSHMTLFTGLLPAAHGVRNLANRLPDGVPTLPMLLRRAGYTTAAVTEDFVLARGLGFGRGFHAYSESREVKGALGTPGLARQTFRRALDWLRGRPPEPFFLFLHTYQVHAPYLPRDAFLRAVRPARDGGGADDPAWRYDAEIRYTDAVLGAFVARLARSGVLERTLLVVTSDHGDAFGEHGAEGHGGTLWDEVMRVPLVLRGPGIAPGTRVAAPVGLVDVLPTLLDLAGVPAPDGLHGRSLRPLLRAEPSAPRALVAEVRGLVVNPNAPVDLRAVWLGDRKVMYDRTAGRWQVFDLRADPLERRDVSAADADTLAAARRVLAWYEQLGAARADQAPPALSDEMREKLRALGYVD